MYYVYVLYSELDRGLYIGYSANLRRRMAEHRLGLSAATRYRRPWRLVYYEAYLELDDALGRERFLKSGAGRTYLKKQCRRFFEFNALRSTA
jgi:putative endonuclease